MNEYKQTEPIEVSFSADMCDDGMHVCPPSIPRMMADAFCEFMGKWISNGNILLVGTDHPHLEKAGGSMYETPLVFNFRVLKDPSEYDRMMSDAKIDDEKFKDRFMIDYHVNFTNWRFDIVRSDGIDGVYLKDTDDAVRFINNIVNEYWKNL